MIKIDDAHDLVPRNQPAAEEKLGLLDLLLVVGLLLLLWISCSSSSRWPAPPLQDGELLLAA